MKPIMENRQVERILSLIVILYGLRLIIPNIVELILYLQASGYHPGTAFTLSKILVGCLMILVFPRIVQGVGYFATEGKLRSRRCWFSHEILAAPIILYAFAEYLYVFIFGVYLIEMIFRYGSVTGWWYLYDGRRAVAEGLQLLTYFAVAVTLLFYARRIAVWLLQIALTESAASTEKHPK